LEGNDVRANRSRQQQTKATRLTRTHRSTELNSRNGVDRNTSTLPTETRSDKVTSRRRLLPPSIGAASNDADFDESFQGQFRITFYPTIVFRHRVFQCVAIENATTTTTTTRNSLDE